MDIKDQTESSTPRILSDIRPRPPEDAAGPEPSSEPVLGSFSLRPESKLTQPSVGYRRLKRFLKWTGISILALVLISGIMVFLYLGDLRNDFREQVAYRWEGLSQAITGGDDSGLGGGDPPSLRPRSGFLPIAEMASIISQMMPFFQSGTQAVKSFQSIVALMLVLGGETDQLLSNLSDYLFKNRGAELLADLSRIRETLKEVESQAGQLSEATNRMGDKTIADVGFLVSIRSEANRTGRLLDNLVNWLKGDRRIVILLQNTSEMRPSGGFLGGYVDLMLSGGSIKQTIFRDINEVDRGRAEKIIPPLPVQAIASRWRTADANWFANFPDSAEKIASFMDSSSLYQDQAASIDAVVAITPKVVSDLLQLTGPIELPAIKKTITSDNFLREIQTEVQSGQANDSEYPKQVLRDLLPLFLERLRSLGGDARMLARSFNWTENRDVQVYFRERDLQNAADAYGITGRIFELPTDWNGGYLSVIASNLGGGKSDIFMQDKATLQVQIQSDGIISNHLILSREHQGSRAKDWWYKEENQRYMRILVPNGARVTSAEGIWERTVKPRANYREGDFKTDPDIIRMESREADSFSTPGVVVGAESNKSSIGFWLRTPLGSKREAKLDYEYRAFLSPKNGGVYRFLLERQPGWPAAYRIEISAPVGFRWQENELPVYELDIPPDGPARTTIEITLNQV